MFKSKKQTKLKLQSLNKSFKEMEETHVSFLGSKYKGKYEPKQSILYVLDFVGDVCATQVKQLRDEISFLVNTWKNASKEEHPSVVIRLDSPGGTVTGYGLVADQVKRLKNAGFQVIVTVDQVAASGGYMVSCVADHIIAAPNAIIGSIGVVSNMPNYQELLDKIGVKFTDYTAGEYKRTVTPYQTPSKEAEEHFNESLKSIHDEFKQHISEHRPNVDIEKVGTGEHWSGRKALELGLVDELGVFDDLMLEYIDTHEIIRVYHEKPKKGLFSKGAESLVKTLVQVINEQRFIK